MKKRATHFTWFAASALLLLVGALVNHVRNGDKPNKYVPAIVCVVLVAGYLAALSGSIA